MNLKNHNMLLVLIMLSTLLDTSLQKDPKSKLIFEISEVINDLNNPKIIERRKIEVPVSRNFLTQRTYLRDANDPIIARICKKTGCSCGRSSLHCNAQDVFEVTNDVEDVIRNIDHQIDKRDQSNETYDLLRCGPGCNKLYKHKKKGSDSFTEDFNMASEERDTDDQNLLKAVLSELNEISKSENEQDHKLSTRGALKPEDIYEYYRSAMDQVRKTLMGFIKYRTGLSVVKYLPREVRKGIQAIRDRYRHFKMSDKSLKKQIFQVLLDDILKIKIVPNKNAEVSYDVFMPDWMYLEVVKKKKEKRLRSRKRSVMKRILPLTSQQKIRLLNKPGPKKLLKFVWRRSLGSDIRHYGVPFVLDIQGLAQLN
ncbi:uncharacterized protein LOC123707110 [Pieris brassicae]|uniref:uncharacterized protein LOC123707110 n=1 Tax=Pieris brassicae TaxID=7116 RepID=UPI001E661B50|nr:uncharacterized protein LOC123707110 [Pieris brassicae]